MSQTTSELELNHEGSIICVYDTETFEVLEVFDWNGNDLSHTHWPDTAEDKLFELFQMRDTNTKFGS